MFNEHTYSIPNWELNPELETEVYLQLGGYDALNRPVSQQTGRIGTAMSSVAYSYNEAGLLETVNANAGQKGLKEYVKHVDYNEKGQRKEIVYGNNSKTVYSYDRDSFRLSRLRTLNPDGKVQDLNYTYDPVGNISTIVNLAEDTIFFNNQKVEPSNNYGYDALYRLIFATGREHIGQAGVNANTPDSQTDIFRINLPHPGDGDALQNYEQSYRYDPTGNMQIMRHIAGLGNLIHRWTKTFSYNNNDHDRQQSGIAIATKRNNQLLAYKQGTNIQNYGFDAHGNMQEIQPNAANGQFDLSWNCFDQLKYIDIPTGTAHYLYDASGERSRKVLTDGTNITKERIYFGSLEVYREYNGNSTIKLERESLHIQDDTGRIALVDTKTIDHPSDDTQEQLLRYQYSNHLGSSSLELDATGTIISYEEYYPYGTTSYQATNKAIKAAAKRYRYTGMERDEESGMNYHSARYYLPWLGRWLSADPIGVGDGVNLYAYCQGSPTNKIDSDGRQSETIDVKSTVQDSSNNRKLKYYIIFDESNDNARKEAELAAKDHGVPLHSGITLEQHKKNIERGNYDVVLSIGHGDKKNLAIGTATGETRKGPKWVGVDTLSFVFGGLQDDAIVCFHHCTSGAPGNVLDDLNKRHPNLVLWGNTDSGNGPRNPRKRNVSTNTSLKDYFNDRLSRDFEISRKESSKATNSILEPKTKGKQKIDIGNGIVLTGKAKTRKDETGEGGTNIVFRELPVFGIEKFYRLLEGEEKLLEPILHRLNLTPEAEQRFREGVKILRSRFIDVILPLRSRMAGGG